MPVIAVPSLDDSRVEPFQAVADPDRLHRRGDFIAEGRLVVERLIAARARYDIQALLLSDAALPALAASVDLVPDVPVYVCAATEFRRLAGLNLHRGCLALARRPAPAAVDDLIAGARTVLVLEAIGNPDNIGGIFRNAAAFGVDAVLLSPGCGDPLYRKAIRTSMAATLTVPFAVLAPWPSTLARLRGIGFRVVALTLQADAVPLSGAALTTIATRLALLLGAEGSGLSADALAHTDLRVRIPMTSAVDSLNVAVACGVALSHLAPVSVS